MVYTVTIAEAREIAIATPKARIMMWVADLDGYVRVTKREVEDMFVGKRCAKDWQVDVREDKFGNNYVFLIAYHHIDDEDCIPF